MPGREQPGYSPRSERGAEETRPRLLQPIPRRTQHSVPQSSIPRQEFPRWYLRSARVIRELESPNDADTGGGGRRGGGGGGRDNTNSGNSKCIQPGTLYYSGMPANATRALASALEAQRNAAGAQNVRKRPKSIWETVYEPAEAGREEWEEEEEAEEWQNSYPRSVSQISQRSTHSGSSGQSFQLFEDDPWRSDLSTVLADGAQGRAGSRPHTPRAVQRAIADAARPPTMRVVVNQPTTHTYTQEHPTTSNWNPPEEPHNGHDTSEPRPDPERKRTRKLDTHSPTTGRPSSPLHRGSGAGPLPDGRGINTYSRSKTALDNTRSKSGRKRHLTLPMTVEAAEEHSRNSWRRDTTDTLFLQDLRERRKDSGTSSSSDEN